MPALILLIVCVFTVGSSPLFRTNPWVDSNAMLTMGKAMLHGLVPYKDVIDQRGPVLYAIFAIGASIRRTSFSGVFVLQVINILMVYVLSIKIAQDLKIKLVNPVWAGLLGPFAMISTVSFNVSGSPEEFAFASVLYLLYVINHYHQDVEKIPLNVYFLLGFNLSLIFWNKYSLLGSFAVFFLWVAGTLLYRKKFAQLGKIIVASLTGFMTVTLVVIVYFASRNAFGDLINIYFTQNLTAYGSSNQSGLMKFWNFLFLLGKEFGTHVWVLLILLLGWIKNLYEKKPVALELSMFIGANIFVAMQHWVNFYYTLIWLPFFAVALLRLMTIKLPRKVSAAPIKILLVTLLIVMPFYNNNQLNELVLKGEDTSFGNMKYYAQPKFGKIMREETIGRPSLLMLNDLDEGFFLTADALPTTQYWQRLNMGYTQLPKMYWAFNQTLRNRDVDFVIVKILGVPAPNKGDLMAQIEGSVDDHVYGSLIDNYKIRSVAANDPKDCYVLFQKKTGPYSI